MPKLSIIIPCYYNELNIPVTSRELVENEKAFPSDVSFEYIMVDDGSKDKTLEELIKFQNEYPDKVKIVKLAGNVGSFNAIFAGMHYATGDCNVVITADLQDPPELMIRMYYYWKRGVKLVVGNRENREESFLKNLFANTFHKMMKNFALKNIPDGGFDYVLFDKQLKDEILKINEKNTNVLYLLIWLGYDYINIPYTRKQRKLGTSKWTFQKKMKLFIDSFVSFSYFPIRAISVVGIMLGLAALCYGIFILIARFTGTIDVHGWSSLMVVLLFVSSFQMIALGILGEYVWRALDSSRNRPSFITEKFYDKSEPKE